MQVFNSCRKTTRDGSDRSWFPDRPVPILSLFGLLLLVAACSSVPSGSVGFEISDPQDRPIEGVEVRISGSGKQMSGTTDAEGSVIFRSVPEDRYSLTVTAAGFESLKRVMNLRPASFVDLQLSPELRGPAGTADEGEAHAVIDVFYGTDRNRRLTAFERPAGRYGRDRGRRLRLGVSQVSIPRDHRLGEIERPVWWRLEFTPDPDKHVVLLDVAEQPRDQFVRALRHRMDQTTKREAFVFVHGYNVSFPEAIRRAAQMAYDLHHDIVPLVFSWPSRDRLTAYPADEGNVRWAVPHLREFLDLVAEESGAETVHLIGHSLGTRALANVLAAYAEDAADAPGITETRFRQIVLVAPDIDRDIFVRDIASAIVPVGERVTLYGSTRDRALRWSRRFHDSARIGDLSHGVSILPGIDTIDASAVETSFSGHSYYGDADSVLADLYYLLREGLPPDRRHFLDDRELETGRYWVFRRP